MTNPLDDQPPAAKLVYKVLEYEGPCTRSEIETHATLVDTTVNDALSRLMDSGIVEREYRASDPSTPVYAIPPEIREEAEV